MNRLLLFTIMLVLTINIQAQRKTTIVESPNEVQTESMVLKRKVAIGRFSNETQYAKGIF